MPLPELAFDDAASQNLPELAFEDDAPAPTYNDPKRKKAKEPTFWSESMDTVKGAASGIGSLAKKAGTGDWAGASRDLMQPNLDAINRAGESFGEKDYTSAVRHGIAGAVPLIGPMGERGGDLAQEGKYGAAAGSTAANIGLLAAPLLPKAVRPVARGVGRAGIGTARALGKSSLKPSKHLASKGVVDTMLEEGASNRTKTKSIIASEEAAVDQIIDSGPPGRKANPGKVATYTNELRKDYGKRGAPTESLDALDRVVNDFYTADREGGFIARPGKAARNLTAREAHDIKKATYQEVGDVAYTERKTPKVEAKKAIARAMKDVVGELAPETKSHLAREGRAIDLDHALENAIHRETNRGGGGVLNAPTLIGAAVGGFPGGITGHLLHNVLRDGTVQRRTAILIYKGSKGLKTFGEAKSLSATLPERLKAMYEAYDRGEIPGLATKPPGLSVMSTYEPGQSLPRTKVEMFKAAAAVLEKHGDMPVKKFAKTMLDEAGPEWQVATSPKGKTETIAPGVMLAGGRAQLARFRTLSKDGVASMGLTPHKTIAERSDAGLRFGGDKFYSGDVQKLVARYGEDKAREMMTNESIASPNQKLETSVEQMLDLEQFQNFGGEPPQLGRYEKNAGKQLSAGRATGEKVEGYDYAKKVELPGGPKVKEPKWLPVDTIHTQGSGFSNLKTGTINKKTGRENQRSVTGDIRSYTDMQLRMETKRLGLDRGRGQASNWVGTQRDLFKTHGKATPWAKLVMDEIDRREAEGIKVTADKFEFGENAPTDMGRNLGTGIEYVTRKYSAQSASLMEQPEKNGGGGFTMTREGKSPTEGYSYSPYKQHEKIFKRAVHSGDIERYARDMEGLLSQPNHHLGGWKDGKRRFLDVSVHEMDFETAMRKAQEAGQESIRDHKNGVNIPVPKRKRFVSEENPNDPMSDLGRESSGDTTTIVRMKDGRILESEPQPTSTTKNLPTHLSLVEGHGLRVEDVAETGWKVNGEMDWGGGGTVGKGGFTLGEYDAKKAKS